MMTPEDQDRVGRLNALTITIDLESAKVREARKRLQAALRVRAEIVCPYKVGEWICEFDASGRTDDPYRTWSRVAAIRGTMRGRYYRIVYQPQYVVLPSDKHPVTTADGGYAIVKD